MVLYKFTVSVAFEPSSIDNADLQAVIDSPFFAQGCLVSSAVIAEEIQSNLESVGGVIRATVETNGDMPRVCNNCGCIFFVREGNMRKIYCSYKCNRSASVQRFRANLIKKRITQETKEAK
jgi:hypothetical protein